MPRTSTASHRTNDSKCHRGWLSRPRPAQNGTRSRTLRTVTIQQGSGRVCRGLHAWGRTRRSSEALADRPNPTPTGLSRALPPPRKTEGAPTCAAAHGGTCHSPRPSTAAWSAVSFHPKVARNRLHTLSIARDGDGLVRLLPAVHGAPQRYNAVCIGIHTDVLEALQMLSSHLRLDFRRNDRVLDVGGRMAAIHFRVRSMGGNGSQGCSNYETCCRELMRHDHHLRCLDCDWHRSARPFGGKSVAVAF